MTAAIKVEYATFCAEVDARELLAAIKLVLGTARPSAMEVISRVFIEQGEHGLVLASTDLLNSTRVTVPRLSVSGSGSAHVHPAGLLSFAQVAARSDAGAVTLSFERGTLTMAFGRRRLSSFAGYGEDYPTLPGRLKGEPLKIERRALLALLADGLKFASKDDTRPHLNGLLIRRVDGALHAVATDGARLVKLTHEMPGAAPAFEALLPYKGASLWVRALKASRMDEVELRKSLSIAELRVGLREVATKLIDATFPPYEHVIPTRWDHEITLPRDVLVDAARLAIAMRTDGCERVLKLCSSGDGTVTLSSHNSEGEFEETVDCDSLAFRVAVKAKFLLDALALGRDPRASLRISGELDPITIVNERASAVVMPMRV